MTVVFASGTPEEEICQYTVKNGIPAYIVYHEKPVELYEDAAFTQPFTGVNGRTEYTIYVKITEE